MGVAGNQLLLLWDIDHTLIENSGVSKAVYALAFEKLTGQAPAVRPSTEGRTDYEIMQKLFAENETTVSATHKAWLHAALVDAMEVLCPRLMRDGYPLPGATQALQTIAGIAGITQSVLTGNIRSNAEAKLRLLGDAGSCLDLEVGGYGSDHTIRSRLVEIAQRRATTRYGIPFGRTSTVLIGDTERDIAAALDGGAQVIGVASGVTTEQDLRSAGAPVIIPDLVDVSALLQGLHDLTGRELVAPS